MILLQDKLLERSEVHIDMEDRGYQFGDGIYEVIRVYNGRFFGITEHMERLARSAREIQLELPNSIEHLTIQLESLIQANDLKEGYVYLQVTRGVFERMHHFPSNQTCTLVAYTKQTPRPIEMMTKGVRAITAEDIRWLRCDIKSLNLLGNVLCKQKAKDADCDEAILLRDGIVTEGSSSNVYIIKDGELWTHPANNFILNGITRNELINIAQSLEIKVHETEFGLRSLLEADEVLITSTTMEICPVIEVDNNPIGMGQPGVITQKLQEKLTERINLVQKV